MKISYIYLLAFSLLSQYGFSSIQQKEELESAPVSGLLIASSIVGGQEYSEPSALGHWGVGNGGDSLRIGFAEARKHAAEILTRLSITAINTIEDQEAKTWLQANKQKLASDILASEHIWYTEEKPTCAWTVMPENNEPIPTAKPIQLSYPVCRDSIKSFYEATQLLIHESLHHFGEGETLADKVAIAVVDAWKEGRIEWIPTNLTNAPSSRQKHSAVWTGSKMIVFGGYDSVTGTALADGGIFDPEANTWTTFSLPGISGRYFHDAHWTGESMIVWGGYRSNSNDSTTWQYDGFIWTPKDNSIQLIAKPSWTPAISTWVFDPRQESIWTGDKLIVWGGIDEATGQPLGGIYDPKTDSWSSMNNSNEYAPKKIAGHSLTWTGEQLVIWGGYEGVSGNDREISNTGSIYTPATNTWTPVPVTEMTPTARAGHQASWTGKELLIFSGGGVRSQRELKSTGGSFNLDSLTWNPIGTEMVIERLGHSATWNGHENLVYGGKSNRLRTYFSEVYRFDPVSKRWVGINSRFTPASRWYHTAIWTGSSLIIWGGNAGTNADLNDGGIYYP